MCRAMQFLRQFTEATEGMDLPARTSDGHFEQRRSARRSFLKCSN